MPLPPKKCVLTGYSDRGINFISTEGPIVEYEFMPIGRAKFAAPTYINLKNQDKPQPILAGICRNRFDEGEQPILIDSNFIHNGINQYPYPKTFHEKAFHLLKFMYNHGGRESKNFDFHSYTEYPLCYCENEEEFERIIDYLYSDKAFIRYTAKPSPGDYHIKLSQSGIDEVQKASQKTNMNNASIQIIPSDNNIFIVHGHDMGVKESVARTISKLGLNPIILHEQPNAGRTIIEKFEANSNVGFAVVLLTDDDLGKAKSDPDHKKRARQNVVLELGFFFGRLGRSRVVPLYAEGVELPSDLDGLGYIKLDSAGNWKFDLAKELKHVGYEIDFNKLI